MLSEMTMDQLRAYSGSSDEPEDFDAFWTESVGEARQAAVHGPLPEPKAQAEPTALATVDVYDFAFPGYGGEPIRAWLRIPRGLRAQAPAVVEFPGYGGGRGYPFQSLLWASAGYVHLHMDARGQGSEWGLGVTPDTGASGPAASGFMTRGIEDPRDYYFRRLAVDAVRAVDAVTTLPMVDPGRIGALGGSQGGGLALAAAALNPSVRAVAARVPFPCDFRRGVDLAEERPFTEIARYLSIHRRDEERTWRTLSYVDGVNFARRSRVPGLFSVGLRDTSVPPSTVYAAHNAYPGPKWLAVWPHNAHEAGGPEDDIAALEFFAANLG
ncbi:MAG: acetylxylan esterase [Bifidobacteriaceae bacterium]|jgi:cephalosporin-C deacetylase|nr:acetylxylan esterase [Bifidobacteriaceae bacterium]